MEQPITALQTPDCDWLFHRFIDMNFSKLTDSNQIFKNDFVYLHDRLCKISSEIIEYIIFANYYLSISTIYSMVLLTLLIENKTSVIINCVNFKTFSNWVVTQYMACYY